MVDTIADNASCDAYALIFTQAKMEINNINKDNYTFMPNVGVRFYRIVPQHYIFQGSN